MAGFRELPETQRQAPIIEPWTEETDPSYPDGIIVAIKISSDLQQVSNTENKFMLKLIKTLLIQLRLTF